LDVAGRHSFRVEGHDLVVETGESPLMLGDQLRLEGAVAIAGRLHPDVAHITADRLGGMSVAAILSRGRNVVD
jgi:hypothetical protein